MTVLQDVRLKLQQQNLTGEEEAENKWREKSHHHVFKDCYSNVSVLFLVIASVVVLSGCLRNSEETAGHPVKLPNGKYYKIIWQAEKWEWKRQTGIALVQDLIPEKKILEREPLYVWFRFEHYPLPDCFRTRETPPTRDKRGTFEIMPAPCPSN